MQAAGEICSTYLAMFGDVGGSLPRLDCPSTNLDSVQNIHCTHVLSFGLCYLLTSRDVQCTFSLFKGVQYMRRFVLHIMSLISQLCDLSAKQPPPNLVNL